MTKYKENDIIFHTKNGEFEVAVVTEAVNAHNICCLTVVNQAGKKETVYDLYNKVRLGYNIQKITKRVYNKFANGAKKYKEMIDNFDAEKAIANYKNSCTF